MTQINIMIIMALVRYRTVLVRDREKTSEFRADSFVVVVVVAIGPYLCLAFNMPFRVALPFSFIDSLGSKINE